MQFSAICYNLLGEDPIHHPNATGNYLTTGSWSAAAIKEAGKYCQPNEVASNKAAKYATIADPSEWNIKKDAKYFHYCSNETIQGFTMHDFPYEVIPEGQILVADMSSNFCTTRINWEKYGMIYAGAQKNIGPAGVCMGFVRKDLLGKNMRKDTPMLLDWKTFANAPQTFRNTPCCWSIYMCGLNLAHMRA